jgi:hypothetical protein
MADPCKHKDSRSTDDADTGTHIIVCTECHAVTHICFSPLPEDVEKALEEVRVWGVHYAKAAKSPSMGSTLSDKMEAVIGDLRRTCLQARIEKNKVVEAAAKFLSDLGNETAADQVRKLKLEKTVGCEEEKTEEATT